MSDRFSHPNPDVEVQTSSSTVTQYGSVRQTVVVGSKEPKGSKKGLLVWIVGLSGFLGFYLFGLSSCIPSIDFAMQEVANCPLAVERLGEPIQQDWWPGYGSTESSGSWEETQWVLPVKGSKAKGKLYYNYHGSPGMPGFAALLKVGDEEVDIGLCTVKGELGPICEEAYEACMQQERADLRANCENLEKVSEEMCERVLPAYSLGIENAEDAAAPETNETEQDAASQ